MIVGNQLRNTAADSASYTFDVKILQNWQLWTKQTSKCTIHMT